MEQAGLLEAGTLQPMPAAFNPSVRKGKPAARKWLSVAWNGEASLLELPRQRLTQHLGVQLRDLR